MPLRTEAYAWYPLGGMGGNLLCLFLELDSADFAVSAGASGAVFAVMGAMISVRLPDPASQLLLSPHAGSI